MADFNAGSIIGSAELDRDPFTKGLDLARQQAQRFEDDPVTVQLDLAGADEQFAAAKAKVDELDGRTAHVDVDVDADTTAANAKIDALDAKLRDKTVSVDVDADTAKAMAQLGLLGEEVDRLDGRDIDIKTDKSRSDLNLLERSLSRAIGFAGNAGGGGGVGMMGLLGAILAIGPALIPLGGMGLAFGAGIAGGAAQGIIALGAFALAAKGDFDDMKTALGDLTAAQSELLDAKTTKEKAKAIADLTAAQKELVGPIGDAATAYKHMTDAIDKVKEDTAPAVFEAMEKAFGTIADIMPVVEPLITSTAGAIGDAADALDKALSSPAFSGFISFVSSNVGPAFSLITQSFLNFGEGFANLVEALTPLTFKVLEWIEKISEKFDDWAKALNDGGINGFLEYIEQIGPQIGDTLHSMAQAFADIVKHLAPLGGPALDLLKSLFDSLDKFAKGGGLDALVKLFQGIFKSIELALPYLVDFANFVLPKIVEGFEYITEALGPTGTKIAGIILGFSILGAVLASLGIVEFLVSPIGLALLAIAGVAVALSELMEHWAEVSHFIGESWDTMTGAFHDGAQDVASAFEWLWSKASGFAKDIYDDVTTWLNDTFNDVASTFEDAFGKVQNFFSNIYGWITGIFSGSDGWLESAGQDIINGLYTGVTEAWNWVTSWFSEGKATIESFFWGAIDWLYQVGKDILQGLWNGVKDTWNDFTGWLTDKLISLPGVAKIALLSESPSKRFIPVGHTIPQGIAAGVDAEYRDTLAPTMDKMARNLEANFRPRVSFGPAFGVSGTAALAGLAGGQQADIVRELRALRDELRRVPDRTGEAVGATVGTKFTEASRESARTMLTAARRG